MGESEIVFGDKYFLYGQFLQHLPDFDEYEYNAVMGYMTVGGYHVVPVKTDQPDASIPGFVTEILYSPSLAPITPFNRMEMVDVTDNLALSLPLPSGVKVWMPTTP